MNHIEPSQTDFAHLPEEEEAKAEESVAHYDGQAKVFS